MGDLPHQSCRSLRLIFQMVFGHAIDFVLGAKDDTHALVQLTWLQVDSTSRRLSSARACSTAASMTKRLMLHTE